MRGLRPRGWQKQFLHTTLRGFRLVNEVKMAIREWTRNSFRAKSFGVIGALTFSAIVVPVIFTPPSVLQFNKLSRLQHLLKNQNSVRTRSFHTCWRSCELGLH